MTAALPRGRVHSRDALPLGRRAVQGGNDAPTHGLVSHPRELCTLAATLQAKHGIAVSAATVRRWLHELGWVWKRAKLVAKDDDPHRIARLAWIRFRHEHLRAHEVTVFADELDIPLLPKVGAASMMLLRSQRPSSTSP